MKRCISCGKEGDFRLFCPKCYLAEHPVLKGIKKAEIRYCPTCSKLFLKNKWKVVKNLEEAISLTLAEKLSLDHDYTLKQLRVKSNLEETAPKPGPRLQPEATLTLNAHSEENCCDVEDEYVVPITLDTSSCGKCGLGGTQYFEATLQVRNITPEIAQKIKEIVGREKDAGIHINDTVDVKDGAMDFYLTDVHYIKSLGKLLQKKFGGELSMSPRLQTKDNLTSKELFRLSVLLRLPSVRPADYVEHEGRVIKIKKAEETIIGRDIINNTNIKIDARKESPTPLEIYPVTVTKVRPQIEAINPVTYQNAKIENARKQKLGQKIRVVVVGEKLFLVN
jgi:NMD protein affecting ribosome stability and mRNA decay